MHSLNKFIRYILLALALSFSTAFADEDHTPLGEEMSALNKPYRSLSRAFKKEPDPAMKDQYVAWAELILTHAKKSVEILPSMIDGMEPELAAKTSAAYKKDMQKTVTSLEALIEALKAEDFETAKALLDEINQQKKDGHYLYQEGE